MIMLAVHKHALAKRARQAPRRAGEVTTERVSEDAWALALALAGGNPARLRVVSAREVIVQNNGHSQTRW